MQRSYAALSSLIGLLVGAAAATAQPAAPSLPPVPPTPAEQVAQLIARARESCKGIQDYECTFIKRERINGELLPENVVLMKVRSQPFSVYLRWGLPKSLEGQQACYVAGKNNGMMRAHPVGILGIVGWVSVDPFDARAMKQNRHPITDAGIVNLVERIARYWEKQRTSPTSQVQIADYEYNKRPCTRVEVTQPDPSAGAYAYRCVVYYDKVSHLPIRFEAYDWPKSGGTPGGDLLECYSYVNIRTNVGLTDAAFNY
jgi:hypothetical protein